MMQKRAEEVAARVAQFKKLPAGLRLMYAEKTVDEVVRLLVDMAGGFDVMPAQLCEVRARILSLPVEVSKNGEG